MMTTSDEKFQETRVWRTPCNDTIRNGAAYIAQLECIPRHHAEMLNARAEGHNGDQI